MIREVINEAIKMRGVSKTRLADICQTDRGNFSHFLAGRRMMPLDKLEVLLRVLEIEFVIKKQRKKYERRKNEIQGSS